MNRILRLILIIFITYSYIIRAEVNIQITEGIDLAKPIGVIPFKLDCSGIAIENIGSIIANDLRNSGKFNPLDILHLPQKPTSLSEVKISDWITLGIDKIIIGQVQFSTNSNYQITYQLIDISNGNKSIILIKNQYKVTNRWLRYIAHIASDEIFEKLTGIKGAFCTHIAYIAKTDDNNHPYELRIIDYDGYNQVLVYRSKQPIMSPAWSHDGKKIAYVIFENGCSSLVIKKLTNGIIQQVANFPKHNGAPSFSPDGTKLAFVLSKTGSLNLYIMDLKSGQISQLTNNSSNNTEPTWFPDSQTLAYTSDQCGQPQIYKINIYVGQSKRISWGHYQNQNATVSPDGKFIVMVSSSKGIQRISRLNLTTGTMQFLTNTFLDETPSIAPNGVMLVYRYLQGSSSALKIISTDGRFQDNVSIINGQVKFPTWSPYLSS